MNPIARIRPNTPTVILVGGTFTADTGEHLDSRQPWDGDPRSWMGRDSLVESEIWWRTAISLVLPLLDAEGEDSFAMISDIRTLVTANHDGSIRRQRLTSVLPGGFRSATKSVGRWQHIDKLWKPSDSTGQIIVTTDTFSNRSHSNFHRMWLKHGNVTIVAPHTHATSTYLDGYVEWVADGKPEHVPAPQYPRGVNDPKVLPKVLPVEGDFRVTGVLQMGKWVDPAPLEAARMLLQARYDLKLGIWDLVTNDVLRSTLLKETPIVAPPSTPAAMTAGAIERQQLLRERLTDLQKSSAAINAELATLLASLDACGWRSSLPNVLSENPYRRALPLAVAPECDDAEARARHPAVRPGRTILWLQFAIYRGSPAASKVQLVVPAPLTKLTDEILLQFGRKHLGELATIAMPNPVGNRTWILSPVYNFSPEQKARPHSEVEAMVIDDRNTMTYEVMGYDYPGGGLAYREKAVGGNVDWSERVTDIAQRTPAWIEIFAPLAKQCRDAITANPRLGRAQ